MSQFRRASGTAFIAAALLAISGCAADTQDAAAGPSDDTQASTPTAGAAGSPAASASLVGDAPMPAPAMPRSCTDGHLSLQVYNQTGNTLTLSTTNPPSEDDGGMYIDDAFADCLWSDKIDQWSNDGAWMFVNTNNEAGEGEMASEIYWNIDDQGDVMHAHGWGDYNSTQNAEGTNSTQSSCEVTGPNAADFNCHPHNQWDTNWSHGFAHFTLTCANTSSDSACQSWTTLDTTTTPVIDFADTTATAYHIVYPEGAPNDNQYFEDGTATVEVNYQFPANASTKTAYQVTFSDAELGQQSGIPAFSLGGDGCSGNTYIITYNGTDKSGTLCTFDVQFTSATQGGDSGTIMVTLGAAAGASAPATNAEEVTITGTTQELIVALPGAVSDVSVSDPQTTATVTWQQVSDPENAPITGYTVTATPQSPTGTPTPKPTGTGTTQTCATGRATTCQISDLVAGIPYAYTVVASNWVGSGPANPKVYVPGLPPQAAPTGLSGKYSSKVVGANNQYTAVLEFTQVPSSQRGSSSINGVYVQGYTNGSLDPLTTGFCGQGANPLTSCTVIVPTDQLPKYEEGGTFTIAACNEAGSPGPEGCGPASAQVKPVLPSNLKAPGASGAAGSSATGSPSSS